MSSSLIYESPAIPIWAARACDFEEICDALDRVAEGHVLTVVRTLDGAEVLPVRFEDLPPAVRAMLSTAEIRTKPWPLRLLITLADDRIDTVHEMRVREGRSVS